MQNLWAMLGDQAMTQELDAMPSAASDPWALLKEARAEVERLTKGLRMLAKQEYDAGYTPEDFAEAILSGDEPAVEDATP